MTTGTWVIKDTLTLPYGTLQTLHEGASEVRVRMNLVTQDLRVFKKVSAFGREATVAVNEALLLRDIDHPNVARVFDVAEVAGSGPFVDYEIVMPYYPRGSVYDAMSRRGERFRVGAARDMAVAALRGLVHLHDEMQILHRDVKPGNLFLCDDGSIVKVGDLGESVRMDQDRSGEPLAVPQFWSDPETFTGARFTAASDVFSMGMTLGEMLSGPLPYDKYSRDDLGARLQQGRPSVPPRDLKFRSHVPDALRRIVRKAMRSVAQDRYVSANAMLQALLDAHFIDWEWPHITRDSALWEGSWRGDDYRVTGRPVRGRGWRVRAERRYSTGWRKVLGVDESVAPDPEAAAASVFSQIDRDVVNT